MAASAKTVLLQLKGDETDAKRAIEDVRTDLKRMGREETEIRVDIQTARVERQIQQVQRRLENLSKKTATPKVQADTKRAEEQLQLLELRLDRLRLKKVNIDVDLDRGVIERVASGMGTLERRVGGVGGAFTNLLRAIPLFGSFFGFALRGLLSLATQAGAAVGGLIGTLSGFLGASTKMSGALTSIVGGLVSVGLQAVSLGAVLGGLLIGLNAILGAIVALGVALGTLMFSLAAAAGGLAVLGAAFLGVLGPAVLVAIGLFQRFQKILEARKAREQALTAAVTEQKTAEQQRRSALQQLQAAEERLADTVVEGRKAMADAAEEQEDAERSLARSRLNVQEARLNLKDARAELRDFLRDAGAVGPTLNALTKKFSDVDFDPSAAGRTLGDATGKGVSGDKSRELQRKILEIRDAQLTVKDSIDAVGDSERALNEARKKHTQFTQQGLRAYRPYRQALLQVERAEERLRRATNRTSRAQEDYRKKLKELTGTEKETLGNIDKLGKAFSALAKAFTDPIFKAINETFDDLSGKGGFLKDSLRQVGRAFGDVIRAIGGFLGEKDTRDGFREMAGGAAHLARELGGRAFASFLRIMLRVARIALPEMKSMATSVADTFAGWEKKAKTGSFKARIQELIDQFKTWWRLGKEVLGLLGDIFVPTAEEGQRLATTLRRIVRRWREWIQENPDKVRRFLRNMVNRAEDVVEKIKDIVHWMKNELPDAAQKALDLFRELEKLINHIPIIGKNKLEQELEVVVRDPDKFFRREGRNRMGPNYHSGGIVPGSGDVAATLRGGEGVLTENVVAALGASTINALNAAGRGLTPRPVGPGLSTTRNVTLHNHFHTPGGRSADERTAAAQLEREIRLAGG